MRDGERGRERKREGKRKTDRYREIDLYIPTLLFQMPASSIAASAVDSAAYDELDQLMQEFPDWKENHPDFADVVNPPR